MTAPVPPAGQSKSVETKVKASTAATYVGSLVLLSVMQAVGADPLLVTPLPDWLEPIVLAIAPAVVAFLGGYSAPHTQRPDLGDPPVPRPPHRPAEGPTDTP